MLNLGIGQNFAIVFELEVKTGAREYREGGAFGRTIFAQNEELARKIAEAMIGEEVYTWQYLSKVKDVVPTDDDPFISSFCANHYTWERILQRLGLWGNGETVQFHFYQAGIMSIPSGISLTPAQIKHVLPSALKP